MPISANAIKRRIEAPPEGVGRFLQSLQAQGLNKKQIGKLAQKQGDPEAWQNRFKNIVARNNAQGGAALFSGETPSKPRRGNADYTDTTPRQGIGDALSKNNPSSLPNRAANAAGDVGHALMSGVKAPFGGSPKKKYSSYQDAINRRMGKKKK